MRLKTALVSLILSLCPCALCYGQLSFSTVGGEDGYSALRGAYRWEEDNGIVWTPKYSYFRFFDDPEYDGSYSRFGLNISYDLNDDWTLQTEGFLQPQEGGERAYGYKAGALWKPFYYFKGIKNPFIRGAVFQNRHRIDPSLSNFPQSNEVAKPLAKEVETGTELEIGFEFTKWNLKAQYNKVLKYNSKDELLFASAWAEVPYLTAVIQGFIREAYAARFEYQTDFLQPYATWVQYRFAQSAAWAQAVQGGLRLKLWETTIQGGVEIFEPRHEDTRKLFFMLSMEAAF